jgi:starch-binding outer membrane protein, SusD/RagB family
MRKKNIYILCFALVTLMVSCAKDEKLNPVPTTNISDASAFATPDRISNQVRGLYATMRNGNFYGGRYLIYNDIRAEEFLLQDPNEVTGAGVWALTVNNSTNNVKDFWAQAYFTINRCNVFLDGMTASGNAVVGTALAANYTAEARLIRAVSYYSLLQLFARPYADGDGSKPGLPLRLTGNSGSGDYALARSTVAQVYTQILSDLNFAETNLPVTITDALARTSRAHRNTAIALKTRVYLTMQRYSDVITEANKIVSSAAPFTATSGVNHSLQADITNVFKTYTTTESIFSMPFNANETPGTQNQLAYYYTPANSVVAGGVGQGLFSLNPAGIIANTGWTANDKRRTFVKSSGSGSAARYWLFKYTSPSPYTDFVPVIRYAEVLLNLAEARTRSTNTVDAQAVALLNAVRNRSDAGTTFTAASFANAAALVDAILTERRIEFLGEGLRSPDVVRLLQPLPGKSNVPTTAPTAQNYIWPISANELLLNKLMTDN